MQIGHLQFEMLKPISTTDKHLERQILWQQSNLWSVAFSGTFLFAWLSSLNTLLFHQSRQCNTTYCFSLWIFIGGKSQFDWVCLILNPVMSFSLLAGRIFLSCLLGVVFRKADLILLCSFCRILLQQTDDHSMGLSMQYFRSHHQSLRLKQILNDHRKSE